MLKKRNLNSIGNFFIILGVGAFSISFLVLGKGSFITVVAAFLFAFIGIGIKMSYIEIDSEEDDKKFRVWLAKLLIQIGLEGFYIGILVAMGLLLVSPSNASEYNEKIENLENRIEILEEEISR